MELRPPLSPYTPVVAQREVRRSTEARAFLRYACRLLSEMYLQPTVNILYVVQP